MNMNTKTIAMKTIITAFIILFTLPVIVQAQSEPPNGLNELEAYSVFVDAYRSDDFDLALIYGEWIIEARKKTIEGYDDFSLERHLVRMIDVYKGAAGAADDPAEKEELLSKAASVFEIADEAFDENEIDPYDWALREGRFYQENHNDFDASIDKAMAKYEMLYEMDAQRFADEGDGYYARVLLTYLASEDQNDRALTIIDDVEQYAGVELQNAIDELRDSLFNNPEERIEYLESTLADSEGEELEENLNQLVELYTETGQAEKASEKALELYELNPDYANTHRVATLFLEEGNYEEALVYLEEAKDLAGAEAEEAEIALQISESYQQLEEFEKARDFAREAVNAGNGSGIAYMRLASVYAGAISYCTGGDVLERHDRTVYWLVIDYLERAKQEDPSLASDVNNRIESYREAMPSSEDKFFRGWEEGDSFKIDGSLDECYAWVNETTTVK